MADEIALPPLSPEVLSLSQTHRLGAANEPQRIVYALLARTLFEYRSDRITQVLALIFVPFTIAIGALFGFFATGALGWVLGWIGIGDVLVAALAVLVVLAGRAFKELSLDADISLKLSDERVERLCLGRFEKIYDQVELPGLGLFFGFFFGMQHAVLMVTPSHVGLPIEGSFNECFLLTLDNACHGVFLDTCELYGIHWGSPLTHSFYSASVFYAFRIAFDALAFLFGYTLWKRYRLWKFFADYPSDERDVQGVFSWITARCGDDDRWPRHYHDESMFLLISKAYIEGDEVYVERVAHDLPSLRIEPQVRALFRAVDGNMLFPAVKAKDDN